ncbi:methyltransferase N6AMT1 isoform X2 [Heteronotia binoei]|uniref:methyltransferase N6AMT1 isoform X2 n=1 Tax=Heteronotia binoei TaxID=13085 RepID=UPI00292D27C2|nr:methyltransferase N6AMT1 isoform X2 [Heteronotia binoei]
MFPTPWYEHAGPQGPFSEVYEPAEDTFLLLDALDQDAGKLRSANIEICLEVGSGSGVISTFVASLIESKAFYICTDINPAAGLCTVETAIRNKVDIQPIITDLVESHGIEAAWAGGKNGREVMDRLFPVVSDLLSTRGLFYLVTVKENNPDEIIEILQKYGLKGTKAICRRAGSENLAVLRFCKS